MFADPQSVTINSVAQSLVRIESKGLSSTYRTVDGTYLFRISHQISKNRVRRMVRIDKYAVIADPITGANSRQTFGAYIVVDEPIGNGFADADIKYVLSGLMTWLDSTAQDKMLSDQH